MQKESRLFKQSHNSYQHFWSRDSGIATLLKETFQSKRRGKRATSILLAFGGMQVCLIIAVDLLLQKTRTYSNPCANLNRFPLNLRNVELYLREFWLKLVRVFEPPTGITLRPG